MYISDKTKTPLLSILLLTSLFFSCTNKESVKEKKINSPELEKVISHYKRDPKDISKLNAAYFLIENLDHKHSINNERYFPYRDTILKYGDNPALLEQKLKALKGDYSQVSYIPDISNITADYLIENIELAFEVYDNSPWKKEVDFNTFCEFILPYRIESEVLENWRAQILSETNNLVADSLKMRDAAELYVKMLSESKKDFVLRWGRGGLNSPDLTYSVLNKLSVGSCKELSAYTIFYLRALGIPTAEDFAPQYANFNIGHSWNAIIMNEAKSVPFIIPVKDTLGIYREMHYIVAKVYRNAYSKQNIELAERTANIDELPSFFREPHIIDVTDQYTQTIDIDIDLPKTLFGKRSVSSLSLFNRLSPVPIALAVPKGGKAHFKKVGVESVYLPLSFNNNRTLIDGYPFYIDRDKSIVELKPNKDSLITINVLRKYPLFPLIQYYIERMIGGVFEGANKADFSDAEILYTIKESPGECYNNIEIPPKNYRYVRYRGGPDSFGNIGELAFFENDEQEAPLKGKIISQGESFSENTTAEKAFDQNEVSYFDAKGDNVWVGIDFGKQQRVGKIKFIARTDYNIIAEGNLYELYYWDNGWVPLGQKNATSNVLSYENVPSNCLYFVKNFTEGVEERIFTYEDGKQVWW